MSFNLMDVIVIAVILIAGFIGYKVGFVRTIISFFSFFIAISLALLLYKPLAVILTEQTEIDDWIQDRIINFNISSGDVKVEKTEPDIVKTDTNENETTHNEITAALANLPEILSEKLDLDTMKDNAKQEIAKRASELIMNLISLVTIFVLVKLTLFIASIVLGGMAKIPGLKQLNETLGMLVGAVIGLLNIYLVFAIFTFVSSITNIDFIINAIKTSMFASVIFNNNIIIRFIFK